MRYKQKKEDNMATLAIGNKQSFENLKQRAALRKQKVDLRHVPNEHDISIANENARILSLSQYKTIKK